MKIRLISVLTVFAVLATVCFSGNNIFSAESYSVDNQAIVNEILIKNDNLSFLYNTEKGNFSLTDNKLDITFFSNPKDALTNKNLKGVNRTNTQSQLILVLSDKMGNEMILNSTVESVNKAGLKVVSKNDKITATYKFPDYNIEIPVAYSLEKERLMVTVDADKIKIKEKDLFLREIRVLPYFGAGGNNDDGYFIVPDGCGSVIDFHSAKTPSYSQQMFGRDRGKVLKAMSVNEQPALLPFIATSFENYGGKTAGLLSYIEEGASLATAYADAETNNKYYNSACFGFIYRDFDLVTLMDSSSNAKDVIINEANHVSNVKYKISYTITSNNMIDLATKTRERVFGGEKISKLKDSALPVYTKIYMSVRKTKYFLGIPYNGNQKLTDVQQCNEIINGFDGLPVIMSLTGIDSDGATGGRIDDKLNLKGNIISLKDLKDMIKASKENGGAVYPVVEFTEYSKGNRNNRVLSVANLTVEKKFFDCGTMKEKSEYGVLYFLNHNKITNNVNSWIKSATKQEINLCAPLSVSNSPYRSGGDKNMDRNSTQKTFVKALSEFEKSDFNLLLETAASYAIPYAEHIREMPVSSSGFAACSYEIPFLQMVIHGVKSYSMPSINLSGNEKYYMLKAIETGSSLDYSLVGAEYSYLKETPLDVLNGTEYSLWKSKAKEQALILADCMHGTVGSYITDYQIINNQVRIVEYENGSRFLINYSDEDYVYNDITVNAMNYKKLNEEEF